MLSKDQCYWIRAEMFKTVVAKLFFPRAIKNNFFFFRIITVLADGISTI
jgi:hypothetical protein